MQGKSRREMLFSLRLYRPCFMRLLVIRGVREAEMAPEPTLRPLSPPPPTHAPGNDTKVKRQERADQVRERS